MAKMISMRLVADHNRFRRICTVGLRRMARRLPIYAAEAIGFVVAEIRLHIIPAARKFKNRLRESGRALHLTSERTEPKLSETIVNVPQGGVRITPAPSNKKYTYEWAVQRMFELEQQGIADVVSYFNNEMTDWWLAPNGMMEQEADFEGIALAIEERWHS